MRTHSRRLRCFVVGLAVALAAGAAVDAGAAGSVSTVSPRPLAMGGAFLAVDDEIAALAWNPAALRPPLCNRDGTFRVHLNVLGGPAVARETGLLTGVETPPFRDLPGHEKLLVAVGSVLKSLTFGRGGFSAGVLFLEEQLDPVKLAESRGLADAEDLLDAYSMDLTMAFVLDPRVSIGATGTVYYGWDDAGERLTGVGRSYGVLLRPNGAVTVGITYFDLAAGFAGYRRAIEGLAPRTMNAGVAYRPHQSLLLAFDLRDLAEKHSDTGLEPRLGVEWDPWGRFALRAGSYREDNGDSYVVTLGIGAIPMVGCWEGGDRSRSDAFVLNYAVLLRQDAGPRHLLSAFLHL